MLPLTQLDSMSKAQIETIGKSRLIDINEVKLNKTMPLDVRFQDFIQQIGNPYHFRCGDIGVNVKYAPDSKTLDTSIKTYFTRLRNR